MQVYVQKSTSTTRPRSPSGVSGSEFSQPVAPANEGREPSTGNSPESPARRCTNDLTKPGRPDGVATVDGSDISGSPDKGVRDRTAAAPARASPPAAIVAAVAPSTRRRLW